MFNGKELRKTAAAAIGATLLSGCSTTETSYKAEASEVLASATLPPKEALYALPPTMPKTSTDLASVARLVSLLGTDDHTEVTIIRHKDEQGPEICIIKTIHPPRSELKAQTSPQALEIMLRAQRMLLIELMEQRPTHILVEGQQQDEIRFDRLTLLMNPALAELARQIRDAFPNTYSVPAQLSPEQAELLSGPIWAPVVYAALNPGCVLHGIPASSENADEMAAQRALEFLWAYPGQDVVLVMGREHRPEQLLAQASPPGAGLIVVEWPGIWPLFPVYTSQLLRDLADFRPESTEEELQREDLQLRLVEASVGVYAQDFKLLPSQAQLTAVDKIIRSGEISDTDLRRYLANNAKGDEVREAIDKL